MNSFELVSLDRFRDLVYGALSAILCSVASTLEKLDLFIHVQDTDKCDYKECCGGKG